MNKSKALRWVLMTIPVLLLVAGFAQVAASAVSPRAVVKLVESPRTVVLYGVSKGDYEQAVETFHRLVNLRNSQGLKAAGDWGTFVYLTPQGSGSDQLIEVRIPVEARALELTSRVPDLAASFQLGTAGVKVVGRNPELQIEKPIGVKDPSEYYSKIYGVIQANNLQVSGPPSMVFAKSEEIPGECEAEEIAATLTVPVARNLDLDDLRNRLRGGRQ